MNGELQKKIEALKDALNAIDVTDKRPVLGLDYDPYQKMFRVHVTEGNYPYGRKQYVWLGGNTYPWEKQVIVNGVIYFNCITQEQFESETGAEK